MTRDRVRLTITPRDSNDHRIEIRIPISISCFDCAVAAELNLEVDRRLGTKRHGLPAKDHMVDVWLDHVNVVRRISVSPQVGPHARDHCQTLKVRVACDGEIEWPEIRIRYCDIGCDLKIQRSVC